MIANPLTWAMLLIGFFALLKDLRQPKRRRESLLLLSLLLPLGSLVFYRNVLAYFFVFVMPTALVVAGVRFEGFLDDARKGRIVPALPLLGLIIAGTMIALGLHYRHALHHDLVAGSRRLANQREILENVHRIFPQPVPYIDGHSMVSSFPKVGFFMSAVGFRGYEKSGPIFSELLRERHPVFLLTNSPALLVHDEALPASPPPGHRLHPEDEHVLRTHFVHHWGPLYVVGESTFLPQDTPARIEIIVPGTYTLEAEGYVLVNGVRHESGGTVELSRGPHTLSSPDRAQAIVLRWGEHLYRPS